MTDEQLKEIVAKAEAATPGPWEGDNGDVYTEWSREAYAEERGYKPGGTGFDEIRICEINAYSADVSDEEVKANEKFIAHAHTDIPALLAHIAHLESARAKAEADKAVLQQKLERALNQAKLQADIAKLAWDGEIPSPLPGHTRMTEEEMLAEQERLNCPWCSGSGHVGDCDEAGQAVKEEIVKLTGDKAVLMEALKEIINISAKTREFIHDGIAGNVEVEIDKITLSAVSALARVKESSCPNT